MYNILLKKKQTKASKDFYNCVRQTGLVNKTLKGGAVGNGGASPIREMSGGVLCVSPECTETRQVFDTLRYNRADICTNEFDSSPYVLQVY